MKMPYRITQADMERGESRGKFRPNAWVIIDLRNEHIEIIMAKRPPTIRRRFGAMMTSSLANHNYHQLWGS